MVRIPVEGAEETLAEVPAVEAPAVEAPVDEAGSAKVPEGAIWQPENNYGTLHLGIDVGSTTVKLAVLNDDNGIGLRQVPAPSHRCACLRP